MREYGFGLLSQQSSTGGFTRRRLLASAGAAMAASAVPLHARAGKPFDALVIGAGLSGLHAAMLLESQGLRVLTLEGRNRLGGRVYTLMGVPGEPEAAGELIGGNYARMLSAARELKLELFEPVDSTVRNQRYFHLRGQQITADEWPEHRLNPLKGDDRELPPDRMLWTLSHRNNPLSGRPLDDWITPEFARFDIPHSQYMREHLGMSAETIRLMNVIIHTDHIDNTSALHELRRYAVNEFNAAMSASRPDVPVSQQIRGGNSLMPKAMAESLKEGVLLNKSVVAMADDGTQVTVHCADGTAYKAKQVVCSVPYPVLRNIKLEPRAPDRLARAIDQIDYGISIQVHFGIKRDFWKDDGLPKNIWSDSPFERFAVLNRGENDSPSSAIAFINGNDAYRYDFMTDEEAFKYTLGELVKVRPSLEGALEPLVVQSCHRDVHGSGDWVFWRPGQVTEFAAHMREPHGNIHFAGEHTALLERGMEGAFESGERAAMDVLQRI